MVRVVSDPTLMKVIPGEGIRPWIPAVKPEVVSPVQTHKRLGTSQRDHCGPTKKSRRSLNSTDLDIEDMRNDSGSDDSNDGEGDFNTNFGDSDDRAATGNTSFCDDLSKILRDNIINEVEDETQAVKMEDSGRTDRVIETSMSVVTESGESENSERVKERHTPAAPDNFVWSEDFSSFTGKKEVYSRVPGPSFSFQEPTQVFEEIWDREFMESVARETNEYAWEVISQLSDPDVGSGIPDYLEAWTDVTVEELYRYFSILILMTFCYRSKIRDYWVEGIMGLMGFRNIMRRTRFLLISKFLHFVSNGDLSLRGNVRKIEKIAPVLDHCNRKFVALYTPSQHLSLDESLLLWKGRLSFKQSIRSKVARFGIKTFELCEAETGYLLQCRLYTGKWHVMDRDIIHGFREHTPKIVLDLMERYLDVGHVLVMDNWYNQLALTRYLKTRRTDVLGTLNRRRQAIPSIIKDLDPKRMCRGRTVSRHSGDIALMAWMDVKLVTIMSTYHQNLMVPGRRSGQAIQKPLAVHEYNKYMGGVDRKDQMLSMFLMERKKCRKWYMKVFKRLLNTSILNSFIIYRKNPAKHQAYSHRQFRFKLAEELLNRYPLVHPGPSRTPVIAQPPSGRLMPGNHFPVYTEMSSGASRKGHKQLRCVRCSALKLRVSVQTLCELCKVALCLGKCWREYHTMPNLK